MAEPQHEERPAPTPAERELLEAAAAPISDGIFEEVLSAALSAGARIDARDEQGRTALLAAAGAGRSAQRLQALLRAGASPYVHDDHHRSSLRLAAEHGSGAAAQALLDAGVSPRIEDLSGWVPIHAAAVNPDPSAAALLATVGPGHSALGAVGLSPIQLAMARGHAQSAGALIAAGASVDSTEPGSGRSVAQWANAQKLGAQVAALAGPQGREALIEAGMDPFSRTEGWVTGLWVAARAGSLDGVQFFLNRDLDLVEGQRQLNDALRAAASSGAAKAPAVIRALVGAGAQVNDMGEDGRDDTALICAAKAGRSHLVGMLVEELGADVNARPKNGAGASAMEAAAAGGHAMTLRALAEARPRDGSRADFGPRAEGVDWTLTLAAKKGGLSAVNALVSMGLDTTIKGSEGRGALWLAASRGSVHAIESLAAAAPGMLEVRDDRLQATPLLIAAIGGHDAAVRALAKLGADLDAVGRDRRAALHHLSGLGHESAARALVDQGANFSLPDHEGRSPFMEAARGGHVALVGAMLMRGADPRLVDRGGRSALIFAAECAEPAAADAMLNGMAACCKGIGAGGLFGRNVLSAALSRHRPDAPAGEREKQAASAFVIRALIASGADVRARGPEGELPIHVAARDGNHEAIEILGAADSPINDRAASGHTPLMLAASAGAGRAVESLLRLGALAELRLPASGTDALDMARTQARSAHGPRRASARAGMRALIEALPHVNAATAENPPPLIWAAMEGDAEMTQLLLSRGADANLANAEGDTPLGLACAQVAEAVRQNPTRFADFSVVASLIEAGASGERARAFGRPAIAYAAEMPKSRSCLNPAARHGYVGSREELCARLIDAGARPADPEAAAALRQAGIDPATLPEVAAQARLRAVVLGQAPAGALRPQGGEEPTAAGPSPAPGPAM